MNTFCPECGFNIPVNEDGCCLSCGATAIGTAVDELFKPDSQKILDRIGKQPKKELLHDIGKLWDNIP